MPTSSSSSSSQPRRAAKDSSIRSSDFFENKERFRAFPGSAILERTFCGRIDTTDPAEYEGVSLTTQLLKKADVMCVSSPTESDRGHNEGGFDYHDFVEDDEEEEYDEDDDDEDSIHESEKPRKIISKHASSSKLLARALVSEVTDNPKTMKHQMLTEREFKLLKAQRAAYRASDTTSRAVGSPGGVGSPRVFHSLAYACTGDDSMTLQPTNPLLMACTPIPDTRRREFPLVEGSDYHVNVPQGPYLVTIGMCLSRRSVAGHPDTVTRQRAYDWNEIQDREYKYVSSTDKYGWRAGGGEAGGPVPSHESPLDGVALKGESEGPSQVAIKEPHVDQVHIPIIHINCPSEEAVDLVIQSLASGDIFIPHMAIQPQAIAVQGNSPPNLIVRFDCERNDDLSPDDWPNWCLEFMHNQLYEYFSSIGAHWMKRPFSLTLAQKVRWKTVKHMNTYFGRAESIIEEWKKKGPQYLNPELSYIQGGATQEEVARPHGIYLFRNGAPTNYFSPNFDPPYTTKMTQALLLNVLNKSWNKRTLEWTSDPIPKLLTPSMLMAVACGCTDPGTSGFMAHEVTTKQRQDQDVVRTTSVRSTDRQPLGPVTARTVNAYKDDIVVRERSATRSPPGRTGLAFQSGLFADSSRSIGSVSSVESDLDYNGASQERSIASSKCPSSPDPPGRVEPLAQETSVDENLVSKTRVATLKDPSPGGFSTSKSFKTANTEMAQSTIQSHKNMSADRSTLSLEYSVDEGATALLGQQFVTAESGSVFSNLSPSKNYMRQPVSQQPQKEAPLSPNHRAFKEMLSLESEFSLSESGSFDSVVPTDEELIAVGWAKALDPNSGAYYYFTLDRTRTVWENPLDPMGDLDSVFA